MLFFSSLHNFDTNFFPGGLTYSGHPLAMAAIVATLDAMTEEGMVENARDIGAQVLGPGLKKLAERYPMIGEARGVGLFWALEFVSDVQKKTPMPAPVMQEMKAALTARGLLSFVVENRIHVVPPCIVSAAQVNEALAIFDEVFALFAPRFA
ncbi:aminotransferase class III-fold pyridoxal phosphate-dependent enzyme [Ectopseudomonas oleovorans]|uniref:aminotransferase class III-fold pyridoxal phosphate-dependent enzyme n=1 Tax=Ectopseudomonas oleovorans TaxID=301 RepID=UPI0035B46419